MGIRKWKHAYSAYELPEDVEKERLRQRELWGLQHHTPERWLSILTEEVGEYAKAMLNMQYTSEDHRSEKYDEMRDEIVQCAAVAISILSDLDGMHIPVDSRDTDDYKIMTPFKDPARWWETVVEG